MLEFLPLIVGIFLAQASPGPNLMAVSSIALGTGRRAGLTAAAGVAAGVFVWAVLFTFGMGAFLDAFPQTLTAMKLLGGGYLVFLGLKALRAGWRGATPDTGVPRLRTGAARAFATGFLVVLTNPKAALMWVAVSIFLASAGVAGAAFLLIGACVSLSAMTIYGSYALLFSTAVARRSYGRLAPFVEAAFGAVFGALGSRLVADGLKELRA